MSLYDHVRQIISILSISVIFATLISCPNSLHQSILVNANIWEMQKEKL